jgi:hypothetical protein
MKTIKTISSSSSSSSSYSSKRSRVIISTPCFTSIRSSKRKLIETKNGDYDELPSFAAVPDDVLCHIFSFLAYDHDHDENNHRRHHIKSTIHHSAGGLYLFLAQVSKTWYNVYKSIYKTTVTSIKMVATSISYIKYVIDHEDEEVPSAAVAVSVDEKRGGGGGKRRQFYYASEIWKYASGAGNIDMLKWLLDESLFGDDITFDAHREATKSGNLNVYKFLYSILEPVDAHQIHYYDAAEGGHLHMIQYFHNNLKVPLKEYDILKGAAFGGHLNVLKWLSSKEGGGLRSRCNVIDIAAKNGHWHCVKYLRDENVQWNSSTAASLAESGNMIGLKLCIYHGCPVDVSVTAAAAKGGHFEILKWLVEKKECPIYKDTMAGAAISGNLAIIVWLREKYCPWDEAVTLNAARGGHVEMLKWLVDANCPLDTYDICDNCANVETLVWARSRGWKWTDELCVIAAKYSRVDLIKHAVESNDDCYLNYDTIKRILYEAITNGNLNILKYLHSIDKFPLCDGEISQLIASKGNLTMFMWTREIGCIWTEQVTNSTAEQGHLSCLKYAMNNGCLPKSRDFLYNSAKNGHLHILKHLYKAGYCQLDVKLYSSSRHYPYIKSWLKEIGCPRYNIIYGIFHDFVNDLQDTTTLTL